MKAKIVISPTLKNAAFRTFSAIGSDLCELDPDMPGIEIAEMVVDANRLDSYGGSKEASEELAALFAAHSYAAVLKALNAACRFSF